MKHALFRVAWLGAVGDGGGVGGLGTALLNGLLDAGVDVTLFVTEGEVPKAIHSSPRLTVASVSSRWRWDRWYSRGSLRAFVTGSVARIRAYRRMVLLLRQRHSQEPFDLIFQMSQTELFNLGRHLNELPPVVVFPCVHAAGELRWHRRESKYARQVENPLVHYLIRLYLIYRARVQRRELSKPALVIGMSHRFNELVRQDYGIDSSRQAVVYNPIEPALGQIRTPEAHDTGRPLRILFVARISVRKGVEQVIELSRRLDDLAGKVELHVIGGATMWSDYRPHLKELNPRIARYLDGMSHERTMQAYDEADVLVLPSHYEPGGIVVGEALSRGVPIVVSDEIGSAEPVEGECCRKFPAGDMDAFEREVRRLLNDMRRDPTPIRTSAREQAATHFLPSKIASEFFSILTSASQHRVASKDSAYDPSHEMLPSS